MDYSADRSDPTHPHPSRQAPPRRSAGAVVGRVRAAIERGQVTVNDAIERDPGAEVLSTAAVVLDVNRPAVRPARSRFGRLYEDDAHPGHRQAGRAADDSGGQGRRRRRGHGAEPRARVHGPAARPGRLRRARCTASTATPRARWRWRCRARRTRPAARSSAVTSSTGSTWRSSRACRRPPSAPSRRRLPRATPPAAGGWRMPGETGIPAVTHYVVRQAYGTGAALWSSRSTPDASTRSACTCSTSAIRCSAIASTARRAAPRPRRAQMLHAWTLAFPHPITGVRVSAEAPPPDDFIRMRARMRGWR